MNLLSARLRNRAIQISNAALGKGQVAHHGLQRSGTNYLNLCMKSLGIRFINFYDPARDHPSHKHFRWQPDKASVMPWDSRYRNTLVVGSIHELDQLAGFPEGCKHIVIRKDIDDWTLSILNWGLRVGWFPDKSAAIKGVQAVRQDYQCYYDFWQGLAEKHPDNVAIVGFESLRADPVILIGVNNQLNIPMKNQDSFNGIFNEVPQSPSDRRVLITKYDLAGYFEQRL